MQPEIDFSAISFNDDSKLKDPPPKSSPIKKTTAKRPSSGPGRPTKASKINEMKEEITGLITMLAIPLKMRDRHSDGSSCADLFLNPETLGLTPEADRFAEQLAVVGVDNKFITKFFDMGDGATKWLMLAMSVQPLAMGIILNHRGGGYANRESQMEGIGA